MNSTEKANLAKFTKDLSILHYAMTFGALAVAFIIYFILVRDGHFNFTDTEDFFLYLCPIVAIGGVFGGMMIYKKRIEAIDHASSLKNKLTAYRAATVGKFALIEGPALICIMALMHTENLLYLVIGLLLMVYLFSQKISEEKIIEELKLDGP